MTAFLDAKIRDPAVSEMAAIVGILKNFQAAGGKRLRPLLCLCGWHAAGGGTHIEAAINAASSLEFFHTFALIHDDVIDRSDTRRGQPSLHRALATARLNDERADRNGARADWFGISAAILLGDLALVFSDEMWRG